MINKVNRQGLKIATFLALMLASAPLQSERIFLIGDSWAKRMVDPLQEVLVENGHPDVTVILALNNCCAFDLRFQSQLNRITSILNLNPDVNIIHLSIGGNDLLRKWWAPIIGTQEEAQLFSSIVEWGEMIVDHIHSIRPDAQILWSSYDYFRPKDQAPPAQLNAAQLQVAEMTAQLAATKPGLTFVDLHGTLQLTYGFNGVAYTEFDPSFPIPPGDPSLPDASLPSPMEAFLLPGQNPNQVDPLHPTHDGYKVVAQVQYDQFYAALLNRQPFQINAGHAGAWYDDETAGQGLLIDVEPESQFMFLAWFTFTAAASNNPDQQHWYTAQGNYTGDTAELILHETLGGLFDDPLQPDTNPVGTVTVNFSDCEQGQMVYSIDTDGRQGTVPLQQLIAGSGAVCEERRSTAALNTEAVDINAGMDGAWLNADTPGQGFLIDAHPNPDGGNFIFVAWFTYGDDSASGQRWLTAQGDFEGATAAIDIHETTGGRFDDPLIPVTAKVGTMTIDFTDCNNAVLAYDLTAEDSGDMAITRLIPGGQALCEELSTPD